MGRHDFDTGFVEAVLNILMQIRINLCQTVGILDVGIDLIYRIPVA